MRVFNEKLSSLTLGLNSNLSIFHPFFCQFSPLSPLSTWVISRISLLYVMSNSMNYPLPETPGKTESDDHLPASVPSANEEISKNLQNKRTKTENDNICSRELLEGQETLSFKQDQKKGSENQRSTKNHPRTPVLEQEIFTVLPQIHGIFFLANSLCLFLRWFTCFKLGDFIELFQ